MRLKTLRINYNHLKDEITKDYFLYLDAFHKAFLVSLIYANTELTPTVPTSILENHYYNHMLSELHHAHLRGENLLGAIHDTMGPHLFSDMDVYLGEFLTKHHEYKTANIYTLTVDNKFNVEITRKVLGRVS